jgi:hypothetical protein
MSFAGGFDDGDAWAAPAPIGSGDIVADAMRKEKLLKCAGYPFALPSARGLTSTEREIAAAQEDLSSEPLRLPAGLFLQLEDYRAHWFS